MDISTPKKVSESAIDYHTHRIFPNDLNAHGTIFGGRVMEIADVLTATVAIRHNGKLCVTLLVDSIKFLAPARQGETLVFMAAVNRAWKTSMEVGIKVISENYETGEKRHIVSAYFTFVGVDENLRPVPVRQVAPETADEKRRYEEAGKRREQRLFGMRRVPQ